MTPHLHQPGECASCDNRHVVGCALALTAARRDELEPLEQARALAERMYAAWIHVPTFARGGWRDRDTEASLYRAEATATKAVDDAVTRWQVWTCRDLAHA